MHPLALRARCRATLPGSLQRSIGHHQRVRVRLYAAYSEGQDSAMREALDLYRQATVMAEAQVRDELMQMHLTETPESKDSFTSDPTQPSCHPSPSSSDPSNPPSSPSLNDQGSMPAAGPRHPGSIRRVPHSPSHTLHALTGFWLEQGLTLQVSERVAREMIQSKSRFCDLTTLAAQVQRLGRIIPGQVQEMIARDIGILEATPAQIAQHYVQLVQLFPHTPDVSELACKQPRLLYCNDLIQQYDAVLCKLTALHPSHSRDEARELLAEHPALIFRMGYYMHVRTLDELPIELQNIMIYTGQGLHQLHQMYSKGSSTKFF